MTSRELVRRTLEGEDPPRVPRQTWLLPWAESNHPQAVERLRRTWSDDIVNAPALYCSPPPVSGERYRRGTYIDEWGCRFSNPQDGIIGLVHDPLIADWSDLETFTPPEAVLDLDVEAINAFCSDSEAFVLAGTVVRPFERLCFLRTMEQALIDLHEQPAELFTLLETIHRFYLREVEAWARTDVDAIALMDDWGTQAGLMVNPAFWSEVFRPLYAEYAGIARAHGKKVFMHSDGHITAIIGELAEAGVDALNSQLFCMDLEELGRLYRGRITFWGEIDRQHILAYGTREEVAAAVEKVYHELWDSGRVIAQCEFGPGAIPENIFAVFETWDRIHPGEGTQPTR